MGVKKNLISKSIVAPKVINKMENQKFFSVTESSL